MHFNRARKMTRTDIRQPYVQYEKLMYNCGMTNCLANIDPYIPLPVCSGPQPQPQTNISWL